MSSDFFGKYKDTQEFEKNQSIEECFRNFDTNRDGVLDDIEFGNLLNTLFSFNGNSYYISKARKEEFFNFFDSNKNQKIELDEFKNFWQTIVKDALFAKSAMIIVDVQNDFIDGTLALKNCPAKEDGNDVVPVINHLVANVPFDLCVYTLDWHPEDHISFLENVDKRKISEKSSTKSDFKLYDTVVFECNGTEIEQRLWPTHCVQDTEGAAFNPNLYILEDTNRALIVKKGTNSEIDSYSAFFDNSKRSETCLNKELRKRGITDLYVCGLATDVCVTATALDGIDLKYRVVVVEDASKGVDSDEINRTRKELITNGALYLNSKQAFKMVTCDDRRPELGYASLLRIK